MPNWCTNNLKVEITNEEGAKRQLEEFINISKIHKSELSLDRTISMPKELEHDNYEENMKKYGVRNWHDWCVENWGTKWDVYANIEEQDDKSITYWFRSAWSPPIKWLQTVAQKYPTLRFQLEFWEYRMDFSGCVTVCNNEITVIDNGSARDSLRESTPGEAEEFKKRLKDKDRTWIIL